ncbi:unnamed protein product [Caenorhabditis angaria]|uniref:G-protein coupled receptors family 1 profile domain-containing protein n=1 Tax=Caenorhabditis angaria TaxID=860376 RepID=A0A9P1IU43_9PELO|nr:unnamed protein product [Caenorhabditis angaria]
MGDEEEEANEKTLKYWKMKYQILSDDYQKLKTRSESLENQLIEIVEQNDSQESTSQQKVENLESKLRESTKRVEQLEAACMFYRSQCRSNGNPNENDLKSLKMPVFEKGEIGPGGKKSDQVKSDQAKIGPGGIGPDKIGPGEIGPGGIGPDKIGPGEIGPGGIGPDKIGPMENITSILASNATLADAVTAVTVENITVRPSSNSSSPYHLDRIRFIYVQVLMVQILLGCSGNLMNLVVLLSRAMRSRTNLIFAAMAFSDLFFLMCHITTVLYFLGPFSKSLFYYNYSQYISGLANWASAISIYCMMYATIERVQVFRSPFKTSKRSASCRFFMIMLAITIGSLFLSLVHFVRPKHRLESRLAQILMMVNMICIVIIPLFVTTILNVLLIMALRKNTMPLRMLNDSQIHKSLIIQRTKNERKVTLMVAVIITCFIVCNTPGAIVFILKEFMPGFDMSNDNILTQAVCNSLTITGKVLNFLLFCLSSGHFRALLKKRLKFIFRINPRPRRNTYSTATKTFSVPLNDL